MFFPHFFPPIHTATEGFVLPQVKNSCCLIKGLKGIAGEFLSAEAARLTNPGHS